MKYLITTMEGVGDNLYTRPLVRKLVEDGHKVWLKTPLPELFADLDVKFCAVTPKFRTQRKNWQRTKVKTVKEPTDATLLAPFYPYEGFMHDGVIGMLETQFGYSAGELDLVFDLPATLAPHGLDLPRGKRLAVVKANTVREEWATPARNCDSAYLLAYTRYLRAKGYYVVSVADADGGAEYLVSPEPDADLKLHKGELSISQLLSLLRDADLALGSPGMFIPGAVSAGTALLIVWGGRGMYDCPELLLDERMNLERVANVLPEKFCRCRQRLHGCDKRIRDHMGKLTAALEALGLNIPHGS